MSQQQSKPARAMESNDGEGPVQGRSQSIYTADGRIITEEELHEWLQEERPSESEAESVDEETARAISSLHKRTSEVVNHDYEATDAKKKASPTSQKD